MHRVGPVCRPVVLALVAAVLALAGCGGGSAAPSSSTPISGGSLTYAIDTAPTCFDPHVSGQDITAEIDRNVFDSLVSVDAKAQFHPWLATSWEAAPDLTSYTFHLRHDVTFTDGEPFDAAAVKANFDHIVAPTTKSRYAASLLGPYAGTELLDQYTAKVDFSRPFAPFLQAASTAYLGFYSPKALTANADKLCAGGPANVGSGPFIFKSYTKNQSVVLTRNPAYRWAPETARHDGPAYLDTLTFRILPEDSVRVGALSSGQVDVARALPPVNVPAVSKDGDLRVMRAAVPGSVYSIYLNTGLAPFDDPRVRSAVQLGINIDQDVKTVYFGQYQRAWSPMSPSTPAYDTSLEKSWPYNPKRAGELLDEAGWTGRDGQGFRTRNGSRLTVVWPAPPREYVREQRDVLAQAIQQDLAKLGVEVTHPSFAIGEYTTQAYSGKFHMLDLAWARFDPDVLRLFFDSASGPPTGQNASFLRDADVDSWLAAGAASLDPAVRADAYGKVQHKVVDVAAVVPMYVETAIIGSSRRVRDLALDPNTWTLFHDAWLDRA
jgi:peptide/nickel transport system substrate-binding protein